MAKKSKLQNPIHISFNPFKLIYLKSKSIFLDFKSKSIFFWILNPIHLIGYELYIDWIHFWIIQIVFWVEFWLRSIQVDLRQFRPRLSKVSSSPRRAESSGTKSNQVGMGQSRAKSFRAKVELSQPWAKSSWVADIELTQVSRGRYQVELAQANV